MWLCLLQVAVVSGDKMAVERKSDDMLKWNGLPQQMQREYNDSHHIVKWRNCKLSVTSNLLEIIEFLFFEV